MHGKVFGKERIRNGHRPYALFCSPTHTKKHAVLPFQKYTYLPLLFFSENNLPLVRVCAFQNIGLHVFVHPHADIQKK